MKRLLSIVIALITLSISSLMLGCENDTTATAAETSAAAVTSESTTATTTSVTTTAVAAETSAAAVMELKPTAKAISLYREMVKLRLSEGTPFLSKDEQELIREWDTRTVFKFHSTVVHAYDLTWNFIREYYYPLVFQDAGYVYLWYTDSYGTVSAIRLDFYRPSEWIGKLHSASENGEVICSTPEYTISHDNGKVELIKYGEIISSVILPSEEYVYCGYSVFEGFLFRCGSDVFSVQYYEGDRLEPLTLIATGVRYVIDADYDLGSDPWSQPLFLMEDGQVLAYYGWNDPENPASPKNLVPLEIEGGYHK